MVTAHKLENSLCWRLVGKVKPKTFAVRMEQQLKAQEEMMAEKDDQIEVLKQLVSVSKKMHLGQVGCSYHGPSCILKRCWELNASLRP